MVEVTTWDRVSLTKLTFDPIDLFGSSRWIPGEELWFHTAPTFGGPSQAQVPHRAVDPAVAASSKYQLVIWQIVCVHPAHVVS